jgi:predicted Zn-dependent peptidase
MKPRGALATLLIAASLVAPGRAQQPDRSRPPALGQAPALKIPAIEKRRLANGLSLWVVELHEVPVVQMTLVIESGSADDPVGQFGLASLTTSMLSVGAGNRSSLEIADALDFLGADLNTASSFDAISIRMHVPVPRLSEALPIMADVALRPRFDREELERLRQERLTDLLQARDDPATIASLALSRVLYGTKHRYGTSTLGTAETIKKFTTNDLRTLYRTAFRPDSATLIVVGDVEPNQIAAQVDAAFGSWRANAGQTASAQTAPPSERRDRQVYLIDKPAAPQTQIRIGRVGVPRSSPDYFPLQVMNTMLGGSFTSRLNMNLREKRGYTYGAGSFFDMRESAGPFSASAGVQTDKTAESLTEFFNELNGILELAPEEEVERSKNYVALRFPGGFETTGDMSRRLEELAVHQLPADYFATYVQRIQGVTAADVQRVARQQIAPAQLAVVVVGDRKAIEPAVRALGLGPLTILTLDEVF